MLLCLALLLLQASAPALEKQAYQAYESRDWATAARLYDAYHASGAGTPSTYDNLGVARTNLGQWSQAESALRRAIEINPLHRWAYNHLGFVYREQGRYDQAIEMFRRQIELSPKDPYAYRNLAATLALVGRLDEADQAAAANEEITYERGAVYIDMACSLNSTNHPDQAKKYLDKAAGAGAERSLLAQESAHYFLTIHNYRRAEEQYRKLVEYQPYEPMIAMRLGSFYWNTGNLEKSAAAFARVISVDDADLVTIRTSANTSKTVALSQLRRSAAASSAVLGDVPLDLGRAALLVRLDRLHRSPERFADACHELLLGQPNRPPVEAWLHDALGWTLAEQGRLAPALEELERAWSLDPGRRLTAYHLAVVLEKSGEPEKALPLYTRSLAPLLPAAIDCGCEQPNLAARDEVARALYTRLRGDPAGFDVYKEGTISDPASYKK